MRPEQIKTITRLEVLKQVRKERRPEIIEGYEINEILEAMSRYADIISGSKRIIPPKPMCGDYFESVLEGMRQSTRVEGLTWKEEFLSDLSAWERKYNN